MKTRVHKEIVSDLDFGNIRPGEHIILKTTGRGEARNAPVEAAYLIGGVTVSVAKFERSVARGDAEYINN